MTEKQEEQWLSGNQAAYRAMLIECAGRLGCNDPMKTAATLADERQDAIMALRGLCERYGIPNDWPDTLYLSDIIEKYIERHWPEEKE
jgi:hypothetical protein